MAFLDTATLTPARAVLYGIRCSFTSVLTLVLCGSYVGIGALAHDLGFSVAWMVTSTLLVWAGPAQVILVSTLGSSPLFETALAVTLTAVRLLPMVAALLPVIRAPGGKPWRLILPAHFVAVSMWVESLRLAPTVPREHRAALCTGIGIGMVAAASTASAAGYYLASNLPPTLAAGMLFLTPLSFVTSISRNARMLSDRLALALGLAVAPVLTMAHAELDLMWTGIIAGTLGYAAHRLREAMRQ